MNLHSPVLSKKYALVTGASRGVGASVALQLGRLGVNVALNYRNKGARADEVAEELLNFKTHPLLLQGDMTVSEDNMKMIATIRAEWGRLDYLVLNASGGLEKGKPEDYAMKLNLTAQLDLVQQVVPLMPSGSCIVFVTSHLAHFYLRQPVPDSYVPVAASKKAGEDALRAMIPDLEARGIRLVVVSGDLIDGTITPRLLERASPGLIEQRRQSVGTLVTVDEFAKAIVDAAVEEALPSGHTIFIGSTSPR